MAWKIRFVVTQQQGSALWECQDAAPRLLLLQLTFSNLGSHCLLLLLLWKTLPGCEQLPARGAMPSEDAVPTARGKSPEAGGHPQPAGVGHPGSF